MIGWLVAALLLLALLRMRSRLELVARAEHELRGPLTAFGLALDSMRRGRAGAEALEAELARARVALTDLSAARRGRRGADAVRAVDLERLVRSSAAAWGARVQWRAGAAVRAADEGRLAQSLGNLLANAAEHGGGEVVVHASRHGRALRLLVANPERGRGLGIAASAARDAGARLSLERGGGEFRATLELPAP